MWRTSADLSVVLSSVKSQANQPLHSEAEYKAALTPGHFWSTLLTGAHVSTDVALVDGEARWWRHTTDETH